MPHAAPLPDPNSSTWTAVVGSISRSAREIARPSNLSSDALSGLQGNLYTNSHRHLIARAVRRGDVGESGVASEADRDAVAETPSGVYAGGSMTATPRTANRVREVLLVGGSRRTTSIDHFAGPRFRPWRSERVPTDSWVLRTWWCPLQRAFVREVAVDAYTCGPGEFMRPE